MKWGGKHYLLKSANTCGQVSALYCFLWYGSVIVALRFGSHQDEAGLPSLDIFASTPSLPSGQWSLGHVGVVDKVV